eukprot:289809-Rhodomonas_salina.2
MEFKRGDIVEQASRNCQLSNPRRTTGTAWDRNACRRAKLTGTEAPSRKRRLRAAGKLEGQSCSDTL